MPQKCDRLLATIHFATIHFATTFVFGGWVLEFWGRGLGLGFMSSGFWYWQNVSGEV